MVQKLKYCGEGRRVFPMIEIANGEGDWTNQRDVKRKNSIQISQYNII